MFCIAAFIVLGIIAIFSASFRPLARKAWHCVLRRVTLRPCDIDFSEEMKGRLFRRIVVTHPRLTRFLDRWIDWLSFAFVALSLWSLVYAAAAGLYLFVYGTCDPRSVESCTLSSEACGVDQERPGFIESWKRGEVITWASGPVLRPLAAIKLIPDRLRTWEPQRFTGPSPSYVEPFDPSRATAVEIIDPSCQFCRALTENLFEAAVQRRMNLTYVLYPIPKGESGTKFPHSLRMAQVIEASKRVIPATLTSDLPGDWRVLKAIFARSTDGSPDRQTRFVLGLTDEEAEQELRRVLQESGYSDAQISEVMHLSESEDIAISLVEQRRIVEEEIRTIRIPTLLIGGRRFDRLIDTETLRRF